MDISPFSGDFYRHKSGEEQITLCFTDDRKKLMISAYSKNTAYTLFIDITSSQLLNLVNSAILGRSVGTPEAKTEDGSGNDHT